MSFQILMVLYLVFLACLIFSINRYARMRSRGTLILMIVFIAIVIALFVYILCTFVLI